MSAGRYVLVGSGIAALRAAESLRQVDGHARITMVSAEPHACYSRPGLAYYLTGELPEARLALRTAAELEALRLERVHGTAAVLDTAARELRLQDGRRLHYDGLLLATGAASLPLPLAGPRPEGVFQLDGLDDARALLARAHEGRTAVVTGGGSTALELVEALAARGVKTHYVLRAERYWPRVLDPSESALVHAALEREGVVLHFGDAVRSAIGNREGRLREVELQSGRRLKADMLVGAIGVQPRTELARAAGLLVGRGVRVDEQLRTSAADVYAAGDVAEVVIARGQGSLDTLWSSAARQGEVAGANLAGGAVRYSPAVPLNITRLGGITTTIVGEIGSAADADLESLTRGQSERWEVSSGGACVRNRGSHSVRVCVRDGRVVGGVVMGDPPAAHALVRMVQAGTEVPDDTLRLWQERSGDLALLLQSHARVACRT